MDRFDDSRLLFVTKTVDQIHGVLSELSRNRKKVQEELRSLVGERYRELLEACDKIVGMDSVCHSIESLSGLSKPVCVKARNAVPNVEEPSGLLLIQNLHSLRCLIDAGLLAESASRYKSVKSALNDVDSLLPQFGQLKQSLQLASDAIVHALKLRILHMSFFSLGFNILDQYVDMQSCLEQLYACSPSKAVSELIQLHLVVGATLEKGSSVDTIVCLSRIMTNCFYYLQHFSGVREGTPQNCRTVDELLQVDSKANDLLPQIFVSVCGFNVLHQEKQSVLEGWAMSPPTATPIHQVDQAQLAEFQNTMETTIAERILLLRGAPEAIETESALLKHATILNNQSVVIFNYSSWVASIRSAFHQLFLLLGTRAVESLELSIISCCSSLEEQCNPEFSSVFQHLNSTAVTLSVLFEKEVGDSSFPIVSHIKETVHVMASKILAVFSSTREKNISTSSLQMLSKLIQKFLNFLIDLHVDSVHLSAIYQQLQLEYTACFKPWMKAVAASLCAELGKEYQSLCKASAAKLRTMCNWSTEIVEGASVHYPSSCTECLANTLFYIQQQLQGIGERATKLIESYVNTEIRGSVTNAFFSVLQYGDYFSDEMLLQTYYDVQLVRLGFAVEGTDNSLEKLVKWIEERVDVVTWSVSHGLIDKSVALQLASLSLAFAFPVDCQDKMGKSQILRAGIEKDRFPLLPVSTPISKLRTESAVSPTSLVTTHENGLFAKGLRGVLAGWA